ncbi:MAG: transglycosylase SLT domain-containing protein [Candidatus Latescibacteria bacterium]|nr:transglycosylase SLT domain-containing protein [Candidatus Latescibacterota bacterium]
MLQSRIVRWLLAGLVASLLALALYLGPLAPRPEPQYTPLEQVALVAQLIARKEYGEALKLLHKVKVDTTTLPQLSRARLALQQIICERALGENQQARLHLRSLEGALPLLEPYRRFWLARALEDGNEEEAAAQYRNLIEQIGHPALLDSAYWRLASLYVEGGQYDQAATLYRDMQRRYPAKTAQILARRAQLQDKRADPAAARHVRLELVRRYPSSRQALQALSRLPRPRTDSEAYGRALVYIRHRRYPKAKSQLKTLLTKGDSLAGQAQYQLAQIYRQQRQYPQAQRAYDKAYRQYGHSDALFHLAGIQVRRGRDTQAIATYSRFAEGHPQHPQTAQALWLAGKAAERNDRFDEAEEFFARLVANHTDSSRFEEAGWTVGFMQYCRGEYRLALKTFEDWSRRANQVHMIDQSLFWAGKAAQRLGQEGQARTFFQLAAQGFPRSYYAARAVSLGFDKAAQRLARPTAGLYPAPEPGPPINGQAYLNRASLFHEVGLTNLAAAEIYQARQLNRGQMTALKVVRDRYENLGFRDRALRLSRHIYGTSKDSSEFYRIFPNHYWEQIVEAATEAQLDPYLVLSVIRQESFFNERAVSGVGARGLMQIMPGTGRKLAQNLGLDSFELDQLFNPAVSIRLGSTYLATQVQTFAADPGPSLGVELGLAAYNGGPEAARGWSRRFPNEDPDAFVERIPYHETRLYVKLILKNYAIYKALFAA